MKKQKGAFRPLSLSMAIGFSPLSLLVVLVSSVLLSSFCYIKNRVFSPYYNEGSRYISSYSILSSYLPLDFTKTPIPLTILTVMFIRPQIFFTALKSASIF